MQLLRRNFRILLFKFAFSATMLITFFSLSNLTADEGFWLLNDLPKKILKNKYDFIPKKEWIDHLMHSSVLFKNDYGSGSFSSSRGLVVTNHHIARSSIQSVSTKEHNYLDDGFYAPTDDQEIKLPGMEIDVLDSITDVTNKILSEIEEEMELNVAYAKRKATIAKIEKDNSDALGLKCEVIELYGGGKYDLYCYKTFTDVRLVLAPEIAMGKFGGDKDNFEYPRYQFDITFLRAYENDEPANTTDFLSWSSKGVSEGELTFMLGHPDRTNRMLTKSSLQFEQDVYIPLVLDLYVNREEVLKAYAKKGEEENRIVQNDLLNNQNSRKLFKGMREAFKNLKIVETADQREKDELKLANSIGLSNSYREVLAKISEVASKQTNWYKRTLLLEYGYAFFTNYFSFARDLVRTSYEDKKPNAEHLPEYRETNRKSLTNKLFAEKTTYKDLEIAKLTASLQLMAKTLGWTDPTVKKILQLKGYKALPEKRNRWLAVRAKELVDGTQLNDVNERKRLYNSSEEAIKDSKDSMIQLVLSIEDECRAIRKQYDTEVREARSQAYGELSKILFKLHGTENYPDGTSTLRFSFGTVEGYQDNGLPLEPWTTISGLFEHENKNGKKFPFLISKSWHDAQNELELTTPFNFISTHDTYSGNSGSPLVNRYGEFVGIHFDSNRYSLGNSYLYNDEKGRGINLNVRVILEALEKVYHADRLLSELTIR